MLPPRPEWRCDQRRIGRSREQPSQTAAKVVLRADFAVDERGLGAVLVSKRSIARPSSRLIRKPDHQELENNSCKRLFRDDYVIPLGSLRSRLRTLNSAVLLQIALVILDRETHVRELPPHAVVHRQVAGCPILRGSIWGVNPEDLDQPLVAWRSCTTTHHLLT